MLRLKRLKVHRFRHVEPGTELHFGDTFNVLLGKNAVGKTTLLELINAVLNDDFSPFHGERRGFDLEYDLVAGGAAEMQCRLARDLVDVPEGARPHAPPELLLGKYGGQFGQPRFQERGKVSWMEEGKDSWNCTIDQRTVKFGAGKEYELDSDPSMGFRPAVFDEALTARRWLDEGRRDLFASWLERAPRFDEADNFISAIAAPSLYDYSGEGGNAYPSMLFAPCWPRKLLEQPHANLTADKNSLRWSSEGYPTLQDIAQSLRFDQLLVTSSVLERWDDKTLFEKPRFSSQSGEHVVVLDRLSFGQRRFFAFLWYLALRERLPVVIDELVNGFHHEWISQSVERLRGRQSFLATQNPLLLDDLPVLGVEEPPATFVRCESRPGAEGELMTWRAFTQEEAARIAKAREVGIQSISETLRFEGLW